MSVINYTPHNVSVYRDGKQCEVFRPSGSVARLEEHTEPAKPAEGLPCIQVTLGAIIGIERPPAGTVVIVSTMIGAALAQQWPDVTIISPDTGPESAVRDVAGRIIGVRRFRRW